MWRIYAKYALPILVTSIIITSFFRETKHYKGKGVLRRKIFKKHSIAIVIILFTVAFITMIILK